VSRYPIPAAPHRRTDVIERSRFITTVERAATVEEAEGFVRRMRAEFPDATHNCWAYVVGPPGSTGRVGMSDDGEPHNTAGRPMLTVLLHANVGDVAAVVTRYYGGTKLGTGGLVRAYSGCVQQAMKELTLGERVDLARLHVDVDHASVSALQRLLPDHEAVVTGQEWGAGATFALELPAANVDALRLAVANLTRGRGVVRGDG
jgi:uncharacterized YigZ family protein